MRCSHSSQMTRTGQRCAPASWSNGRKQNTFTFSFSFPFTVVPRRRLPAGPRQETAVNENENENENVCDEDACDNQTAMVLPMRTLQLRSILLATRFWWSKNL